MSQVIGAKKYGSCSGCENSRLAKTPTFPPFRSCLSISTTFESRVFGNLKLEAIARKHARSLAQVVLRWHVEVWQSSNPEIDHIGKNEEKPGLL
jgi:diketogulonate reductase-like aldo/keto reductase